MDLFLAGGLHGDPLARQELVAWLKELRAEYGQDPQFVATEWDSGTKSKALRDHQRDRFRKFALGLWEDACDPVIAERLSSMVGWEVDAHREVFPNLDPVFLDPIERKTHKGLDGALYFEIVRKRLDNFRGPRTDVDAILQHVRDAEVKAAPAALADAAQKNEGRDAGWVEVFMNEMEKNDNGWAIGVMGAGHASRNHESTCRELLTVRGAHLRDVLFIAYKPPDR